MQNVSGLRRDAQRRHQETLVLWESRRDQIERMYWDQGMLQREIGEVFGVTQTGIGRIMKWLGIPARSRGNWGARNGRFVDGSQSRMYRKVVVKKTCDLCDSNRDLGIHHKNYDHYDNRKENLQVLCASCHSSVHKTVYWQALREGKEPPCSNGPIGWAHD